MNARTVVALAFVLALLGCGSSVQAPAAATSTSTASARCDYYDYRFELDAELRVMTATVCFDGAPPRALVCGPQADAENALNADRISGEQVTPLSSANCRVDLTSLHAGDCVRYAVDLRGASESQSPMSLGLRSPRLVSAQTGAFLLRPDVRSPSMHGHATFELPEGTRASLPWLRDADGYLLDASAFEQVGYAAFGVLDTETVHVADANTATDGRRDVTIDVTILDTLEPSTRVAIAPWIARVAETASQLGGAFPADRAQLLLVPQPGGGGVRFGMVGRGGGPSVLFVLGRESTEKELVESWEPAHELTHLRTPYVVRDDRWLTEGIATYYQEVLRARAGIVTPQHAWKRLVTGLARGQQVGTGRTLREESAQMYNTGAFQRVYWTGAAFALIADVELRRLTQNQASLDRVVLDLQACCAQDTRPWTATQMLARMDEFAGQAVFQSLAARILDQTEFPDVPSTLSALGVIVNDGEVTLDSSAAAVDVRDAIMAPFVADEAAVTGASLTVSP